VITSSSFTILAVMLLQAWVPAAALSVNLVGWSLSAEAFFYLLLPLVLPWLARLSPRTWR
jgi:peptidoglycan/LPS O-acetylase OafA/YrhL